MPKPSLLSQIIAINALLVFGTVLVAITVANLDLDTALEQRAFLVLGVALLVTLLANSLLLRRRFEPLETLIQTMEGADLSAQGIRAPDTGADSADVERLHAAFNRMLARLEAERREGARAVLRAQEAERKRLAQDLHDEVNQALTAILLRLEASAHHAPTELQRELEGTKRLAQQTMEELLRLARELRPTALDDHGLVPALRTQVELFGERAEIETTFACRGTVPSLSSDQQIVIYRVCQESLSNIAQHAQATRVDVELDFVGRPTLRIADNGRGFPDPPPGSAPGHEGGFGVSGMQERALLAGGGLSIESTESRGTTVELVLE